ncbi:MAG: hypothetical protein ABEN55_16785, partial [Bradymonadaceae bacterium]
MILLGGAGAVAEAARAMRKVQKKVDRRAERTKRRSGGRRSHAYEPDRKDFPCVQLCGNCGYFLDDPEVEEA